MPTHQVWCLLIDQNAKRIGNPFKVTFDTHIAELKKAVKENKVTDLSDIVADELIVWYCREPRLYSFLGVFDMDEFLDKADFTQKSKIIQRTSVEALMDSQWSSDDVFLVSMPGLLLSAGARSLYVEYGTAQKDPCLVIRDGLAHLSSLRSPQSPPVQIYDPIFDEFASLLSDPKNQPSQEDRRNVWKLMRTLSAPYENDEKYQLAVVPVITDIFKLPISLVGGFGSGVQANGIVTEGDRILMMSVFIASGGLDASIQAGIHMRHHWIDSSRKPSRDKYCCPTLILSVTGQWLCVLGGVFTDKVVVQRLTDMIWTGVSGLGGEHQIRENARVLVALRTCLEKLKVRPPTHPALSEENNYRPHPRFFPYPTRYTNSDGHEVVFEYVTPLEAEPTSCVTFRAKIVSEPEDRDIVVKFVAQYGEDVHRYLANKGNAPRLLYFGPLSGSGQGGVDEPVCRSLPMQMVVMEYVVPRKTPPSDARDQIEEILVDLHSTGYVVGDLREQNILFDRSGKARLIDFDWSGRYDMDIQHEGLPGEVKKAIGRKRKRTDGDNATGEYARYPVMISDQYEMWVEGMQGCEFILPEHDWAMCKRLCY